MRYFFVLSVFVMAALASCTPKEEEKEPDYDHMVMADEEEWSPTHDDKNVVDCDPQEFTIQDPERKTENVLESYR